jgi:hypothetical protein
MAIVVVASVLVLAVVALALTTRGGGQRLRDIVPTTKPATNDQAGDIEAGDESDEQAGDGQADGP